MGSVEERQLRWFNELSDEEAVGALLLVCHSRHWASEVAAQRPFPDSDALLVAADDTWMALRPEDWLEALDAHPRIGERGGRSAEFSEREQAGLGVAGEDVQSAIAAGNAEYEQRFGHVFLISAEGRSAEEILANLRARLGNDADTELRVAAEEHRRITRLRLRRVLS
ncbi:MAG TPA: 2-oxo-4-hydroxy-4-carboxy-5-ureidoimidazoline decarboxylase [Jiangellaceae bacterium]|nr:2-oxo-4-hydroxy-4-carboxy-5-ureidoimidazoline decarboxylase [Jiangellaceae bacterium]